MELWAFFENSDFQRWKKGALFRQDEIVLTRHDEYLDTDHQLMRDIGCIGIRDAARWYITEPAPDRFDWEWLDRVVAGADSHQLKLYLDLWHYGYPDWLDMMSQDAPPHFANFARQITLRYPAIQHYCVCNEPTLFVENGGFRGRWRPFLNGKQAAAALRRQVCRAIIQASTAIREVRPDAILVLPEPWHASFRRSEDDQAAILDMVMGLKEPDLGGSSDLVSIIGLNHYRDDTVPPFHQMIVHAHQRWPEKTLWLTETSVQSKGWKQSEWFWWMMAETRLAQVSGVHLPVFTWAPVICMYDWVFEDRQLPNGIWAIAEDGSRVPNPLMLESIRLARASGYLR